MRTSSRAGSPSLIDARRCFSASITSFTILRGTMVRRIAVHFCPALAVISRATSLIKSSNSGLSGVASGPRMEQLSESASMLKRTEFSTIAGCDFSIFPVPAEPVKVTTSWQST